MKRTSQLDWLRHVSWLFTALEILSHLSLRLHLFPLRQCLYLYFSLSQMPLRWFYSLQLPMTLLLEFLRPIWWRKREVDRQIEQKECRGKQGKGGGSLGQFSSLYSCSHPPSHLLPLSSLLFQSLDFNRLSLAVICYIPSLPSFIHSSFLWLPSPDSTILILCDQK